MLIKFIKPLIQNAPHIKVLLPIGATLDIPTGEYIKSAKGYNILNGGVGNFWGIAGKGNSHKTGILLFCMQSAMNRLMQTCGTVVLSYDSENTYSHQHIRAMFQKFKTLRENDPLLSGLWQIVDKHTMWGDEFFEEMKKWIKEMVKNKSKMMVRTEFLDASGKKIYKVQLPSLCSIDGITEFETSKIAKIQDKIKLGDDKGLTLFMKMGLDKVRLLSAVGTLVTSSNTYLFLSAHIGKVHAMSQGGMPGQRPEKKISTMKPGEILKGVTDKFYFLLVHLWQTSDPYPLKVSSDDRRILYPRTPSEIDEPMGDLQRLTLTLLRSKTSPSGAIQDIILSQRDGVLPSLTEFHYIKEHGRFGLEGNMQNYKCVLFPKVTLSRIKVREALDNSRELRRAILICSEMRQIFVYRVYRNPKLICTPERLMSDLIQRGYDWDKILATRGWHTLNNSDHPRPSLSTMDLLEMRTGDLVRKEFMSDKKLAGDAQHGKKKQTVTA